MGKSTKKDAIAKLNGLAEKVDDLARLHHEDQEFSKWQRATDLALRNIFGEKAKNIDEFGSVHFSPVAIGWGEGDEVFQAAYVRGLTEAKALLESMVEEIKEYWSEDDGAPAPVKSHTATRTMAESKNIFIIHGRDDGIKETVARLVGNLAYNPIILHEQASGGKTVIEKFEANADACFAIALMTPDDMGGLSGQKEFKPRARQNVIFEFGYFMGRLSRRRVCAITKGDVEIPSDYAGVVYIPMDGAGAWRLLLVREMKAAGLNVDANKVI
jgi:predicted nucleotide-binding protein